MREIKFRVWDNEKNKYFEPIFEGYRGKIEEMLLSQSGELIMRTIDKSIHCPSIFPDRFEAELSIGLTDKNKKTIYFEDIVVMEAKDNKWTFRVEFDKEIGVSAGFYGYTTMEHFSRYGNIEVVGNIHKNPELLK